MRPEHMAKLSTSLRERGENACNHGKTLAYFHGQKHKDTKDPLCSTLAALEERRCPDPFSRISFENRPLLYFGLVSVLDAKERCSDDESKFVSRAEAEVSFLFSECFSRIFLFSFVSFQLRNIRHERRIAGNRKSLAKKAKKAQTSAEAVPVEPIAGGSGAVVGDAVGEVAAEELLAEPVEG